jgi:hypothetical protein
MKEGGSGELAEGDNITGNVLIVKSTIFLS